ncbi:MAG: methionine synthase, partial [Defluviitaleaceae bacterium]|nr:methionine synthase [Defluviitaleaceae bacterium]
SDITYALMLDAAATQLVEETCNNVESAIRVQITAENLYIGTRFSPGYGSLPLQLSSALLELLDAPRRIGLSCTPNHTLTPRKSVTAFVGIFSNAIQPQARSCANCPAQQGCGFSRAE